MSINTESFIRCGRGFSYDPESERLWLDTQETFFGQYTWHLVPKRWYNRAWTWLVGSPYEHPLAFPTSDTVLGFLSDLNQIAPGVPFWVTGNPIDPKDDRDRVAFWATTQDGAQAGPFDLGERVYDLWYRPATAKAEIRQMLQDAGVAVL